MSGSYGLLVLLEFGLAIATAVGLIFITAPYGRHGRAGWGPTVPARVAWIVMESPAPLLFLGVFLAGEHRADVVPLVLLGLWQLHYVQRTFVYPFLLRGGARMPVSIMAMAIAFNTLNAYINARWVSSVGTYPTDWLTDPRFVLGVLVFLTGYSVNLWADRVLRGLRTAGNGYQIPRGGLYRWVSCPNYLGEIVEWFGWALTTWSPAGLAFAVYTAANLAPRAVSNHRWYRERFPDYPPQRRALIPFLA
ncbi:3-oxo-5-alpha-steroid 4-dehydrogenase [Luedemannella flava]|uniref:3-oxo-5-alpha-steroid 4-dehydrogenase n=1 Tax=Luedemannella flava TaxID=349316 RepID=A0ABP4XUE7_9ACTN